MSVAGAIAATSVTGGPSPTRVPTRGGPARGPERADDVGRSRRTIEPTTPGQIAPVVPGGALRTVLGLLSEDAGTHDPRERCKKIADRKKRLACLRDAERHNEEHAALKVMTRNLYIGADLTPVYGVTSPQELPAAAAVFAMVQATDFPAWAKALADEIADVGPHVVGLQEVNLFRSRTPADLAPRPNAATVEYDFLGTRLDELAARGRRHAAVATATNADAEAPAPRRSACRTSGSPTSTSSWRAPTCPRTSSRSPVPCRATSRPPSTSSTRPSAPCPSAAAGRPPTSRRGGGRCGW